MIKIRVTFISLVSNLISYDIVFERMTPMKKRLSILDYIPSYLHSSISNGTCDEELSKYLQTAIDDSSHRKRTLFVPRGVYPVRPATFYDQEDNLPAICCALLRSGLSIIGEYGSKLVVTPNVTTVSQPVTYSIFATDQILRRVSLRYLELDLNGSQNISNAQHTNGRIYRFSQAAICVSGTHDQQAARIDDCELIGLTITNCPGSCCIVAGQSNVRGIRLGRNWIIRLCRFYNNGLNTDDHSSIFSWVDDAVIESNVFYNYNIPYSSNGFGATTAYEVHGSNHTLRGNVITNYFRGVWVASNYSSIVTNTIILDNWFNVTYYGISFYHESASSTRITNTLIANNEFQFDDSNLEYKDSPTLKSAVLIASQYGQDSINIQYNNASKIGLRSASSFLTISSGSVMGETHTGITCKYNTAVGFTFGAFLRTSPTNGIGSIYLTNNSWLQLIAAGVYKSPYSEVALITGTVQAVETLVITDNSVSFAIKNRLLSNHRFEAKISSLNVSNNSTISVD